MDFLNRAFAQLKQAVASLSPAMRLMALVLLAVVVLALGYLFVGEFGGGHELLGGRSFNASEMNAAQRAFAKAGLSDARIQGTRILVPRGEEAAYVAALADEGVLPSDYHLIVDKALTKISPFTPPKQREEIVNNARMEGISNIIRQMRGIEDASVVFDRARERGLYRKENVTASVAVTPQIGQPLPHRRKIAIRNLVAASFAGLEPKNVTLVVDGQTVVGPDGVDEGTGEGDRYFQAMVRYQNLIENKVLTALSFVSNVKVVANVELNPQMDSSEETSTVDDKNKAAISQSESTTQSSRGSQPAGGSPGLDAQTSTPNRGQRLSSSGRQSQSSTERTSKLDTRYEPTRSVRHTRTAGLTPKSVRVNVTVPSSYYGHVREEMKSRYESLDPPQAVPSLDDIAATEKTKIETAVANVIGTFQTDKAAAIAQQVNVSSFTEISRPEPPGVPLTDVTLSWLGRYWTTLGLFCLSAFGLVMLRSMVKSIPPPQPAPEAASSPNEDDDSSKGEQPASKLKRDDPTPSMRDELADIVREDPEAAANVIRGWIGKSG